MTAKDDVTAKLNSAAARYAAGETRSFAVVEVDAEGRVNGYFGAASIDADEYARLLCGVEQLHATLFLNMNAAPVAEGPY